MRNLRRSVVVLGGVEFSWLSLLWLGYGVQRKLSRVIVIGLDMDSYFPAVFDMSLVLVWYDNSFLSCEKCAQEGEEYWLGTGAVTISWYLQMAPLQSADGHGHR